MEDAAETAPQARQEEASPASVPDRPSFPPELDFFNWPAFLLEVIWPLIHGLWGWAALLFFAGVATDGLASAFNEAWWTSAFYFPVLVLSVWFARNANRLVWEKRRERFDVDAYIRTQRRWTKVLGWIAAGVALVLLVMLVPDAVTAIQKLSK